MKLLITILVFGVAIPCASSATPESNPLEPNPVLTLAKRGSDLCAGFGNGAITLDTKTGKINSVTLPAAPTHVFPWGASDWGILAGSELFRWDGRGDRATLVFSNPRPLRRGLEYHGRTFLLSDENLVELLPGEKVRPIVNNLGGMQAADISWWNGTIAGFGNGVYTIDPSSGTVMPKLLVNNFWATTGIATSAGEIIAGGGGWPAIIVSSPDKDGILLSYNFESTYDQIDRFDSENGAVWIASHLTDEGAIWSGNSMLRRYPAGKSVLLPPVFWNDFKVMGSNVFLATGHGLMKFSGDGSSTLYTRSSLWDSSASRNLRAHPQFTVDKQIAGRHLIGGFDETGGGSFVLAQNSNREWRQHKISIEGLMDILPWGGKLLVAGHRTEPEEGGEAQYLGGLAVLSQDFSPKILSTAPMSLRELRGDKARAVGYLPADEDSSCFRVIDYEIDLMKESVAQKETGVSCTGAPKHAPPNASYDARATDARKYFDQESRPVTVTMPVSPEIKEVSLQERASFGTVSISTSPVPLSNPRQFPNQ